MRTFVLFGVFIFSFVTCSFGQDEQNMQVQPQKTDCHDLPDTFVNMREAIKALEGASYRFSQQFKTSKQEGVMAAKFYSCDNEGGYLALKVDGKYEIYRSIPKEHWINLIKTTDLDQYYKDYLKGKFALAIKEQ